MKEIIDQLESYGHWIVNIRPLKFNENRIASLNDCKTIIYDSVVLLRGWDYPHIGKDEITVGGNNWIDGHVDWDYYLEYWRFYQSAQFVHYFACREDRQNQDELRNKVFEIHEHAESFLSMISTLYSVTEIFEFSSRLAQKSIFDDRISISIELKNMANRQLFFHDPMRAIPYPHLCEIDEIKVGGVYHINDILTKSSDFALINTLSIFERFNMERPPEALFREEQKKLLEKRL